MTIICGTDFSENAEQAALAAAALARSMSTSLKLVHVIPELVPEAPFGPLPDPNYSALESTLRAKAQALAARFEIEVEPLAIRGTPHEALVALAEQKRASLIVVSALGAKRQRAWLLGSVAERVAQCSTVPVLVVRDAESILAWSSGGRPLRVLVAADLGVGSKAALRWVSELRHVGPCELSIVQVAWPVGERARLGTVVLAETDRLRPEIQEVLQRDLRVWAGSLANGEGTRFVVSPGWGRVDNHVALLAADEKADLIAVGTHRRARAARCWLGSVSRGVVHYASTNVVCVPRPAGTVEQETIPQFKSVLIPTDFSELGNRAVAVAYGLLGEGGIAHLLHVKTKHGQGEADTKQRLLALVPRGAAAKGITTEIHIVSEVEAAGAIWHSAGRLGVDAICMSTHGRSGLPGLVMGSQAQEVVRRARQPVLLVPPEREV